MTQQYSSTLREELRSTVRRVVIKAGTSVVANPSGSPSLTRLAAIVEQVGELSRGGVEVILVSSGAVGVGKKLLRRQERMNMSIGSQLRSSSWDERTDSRDQKTSREYDSACAAAGQFGLMSIYNTLFEQVDLTASQVLLTRSDFTDVGKMKNLQYSINTLLKNGIVPIVNENDAVSGNLGYDSKMINSSLHFSDNDGLAALCARSFGADCLLLLTDVDGVYDRPPGEPGAEKLDLYVQSDSVTNSRSNSKSNSSSDLNSLKRSGSSGSISNILIGAISKGGRGGMGAKITAACSAVTNETDVTGSENKCCCCAIISGRDLSSIRSVLGTAGDGRQLGTLFFAPDSEYQRRAIEEQERGKLASSESSANEARGKAEAARVEARKLLRLPFRERQRVLRNIACDLEANADDILRANDLDIAAAEENNLETNLLKRLRLTRAKIETLRLGILQLAEAENCLDVVKSKLEVSEGLILSQVTVPIGVLMIIFESRPDSLPQIASLALASGNGLLLKGGREATNSNIALHKIITESVHRTTKGQVGKDIIGLVTSRGEIADMLGLDDVIDLVIPRGGNKLVSYIKENTKIPVLGHADGVCHVYVDKTCSVEKACKLVVDSKVDYPAACNAMETLLLHSDLLTNGSADAIMRSLRTAGVSALGGPVAMREGLCDNAAQEMKVEYGDLRCLVEVVGNVQDAIDHIHKYGSGHTELVVTEDEDVANTFLNSVDAACVFHNASTRFADGFRFGLGAEVGISTGKIHARGPVGVEGLLSTKWKLLSGDSHSVGEFAADALGSTKIYTHRKIAF